MAGYDDPRFLQQKIERLEKDLEALRKATLGFAANQKGALPGAMRAVSLNDRGQNSSMFADFRNLGPGLGPYSAVTDAAGTIRAEWGNLAANGVSLAQFGFRANTAGGVPIFDSLGLIAVMSQPSPSIHPGTNAAWTTASTTPITGSGFTPDSITFTLARQTTMLFLGTLCAKCINAGNTWQAGLSVDINTAIDANSSVPLFASDFSSSPLILSSVLAAGSHTVYMMSQPTPAGGVFVQNGDLYAFQLGA